MNKKSVLKIVIIVCVFIVLAFVGKSFCDSTEEEELVLSGAEKKNEEKIIVTLTGEVKKPGKYSVPLGSTVHEVIYYADGVTDSADLSGLNLGKYIVTDCTIDVPEAIYVPADVVLQEVDDYDGLCNINTASKKELCQLDGIGETIAADIINYREVNGGFKTTEDIMNVPGIGMKKYEAIKNKITVGGN